MIPIACGIFASKGLTLNPMLASFGMMLSSLCVITNSLCLFKIIGGNNHVRKENK